MYKTLLLASIICINFLNAFADIIPDPVKVKGIIPAQPVNVQMVSEQVTVDLYKDSSFVQCVFNMKNFGKAQVLEVGFPMMNFYTWNPNFENPVKAVTDELI
jgi:hypothetical protein